MAWTTALGDFEVVQITGLKSITQRDGKVPLSDFFPHHCSQA
jgi:hypothetical protein